MEDGPLDFDTALGCIDEKLGMTYLEPSSLDTSFYKDSAKGLAGTISECIYGNKDEMYFRVALIHTIPKVSNETKFSDIRFNRSVSIAVHHGKKIPQELTFTEDEEGFVQTNAKPPLPASYDHRVTIDNFFDNFYKMYFNFRMGKKSKD
ncbi:MAG: hypothetical protein ACMXYE_02755 [Candidatus Woesearchaeota archaeon]